MYVDVHGWDRAEIRWVLWPMTPWQKQRFRKATRDMFKDVIVMEAHDRHYDQIAADEDDADDEDIDYEADEDIAVDYAHMVGEYLTVRVWNYYIIEGFISEVQPAEDEANTVVLVRVVSVGLDDGYQGGSHGWPPMGFEAANEPESGEHA